MEINDNLIYAFSEDNVIGASHNAKLWVAASS